MSKWSELPNEILFIITSCLSSREIRALSCVCRNWNRIIARLIFKNITSSLNKSLIQFKELIKASNKGRLVESIEIYNDFKVKDATHIEELAKYCPNVKKLTKPFGVLSCQIWRSFRHFKKLQALPDPEREERSDYELCAEFYKNTLTEYYIFWAHPFGEGEELLRSKVQEFIQLNKLYVIGFPNMTKIMDFDKMISSLPRLKTLFLRLDLSDEDFNTECFLDSRALDLSLIVPHSNIEYLSVLMAYDKHAYEYIIHKFPVLKHLDLNLTYPHTLAIEKENTQWTLNERERLFDYISRIPKYNVCVHCSLESVPEFLKFRNDKTLKMEVVHGNTVDNYDFDLPFLRFEKSATTIAIQRECAPDELLDIWRNSKDIEGLIINHVSHTDFESLQAMVVNALCTCQKIKSIVYHCYYPLTDMVHDDSEMYNPFLEEIKIRSYGIDLETYLIFSESFPSLKRMEVEVHSLYENSSDVDPIDPFVYIPANFDPFGLTCSDLEQVIHEHKVFAPCTFFDHLSLHFNYMIEDCCFLLLARTESGKRKACTVYTVNKQTIVEERINLTRTPKMIVSILCQSIFKISLQQHEILLKDYVLNLK